MTSGWCVGRVGEDVGGEPVDAGGERVVGAELACGAGGVRVEVDAGELDGKVACGGPMGDGDEGVAAAGADVENPKRPRLRGVVLDDAGSYAVKEGEGVAVGAGEVVELGEVAEEVAELFVGAGRIHELGELGGLGAAGIGEGGERRERIGRSELRLHERALSQR